MKITKAMGRACLRELKTGEWERLATEAIDELVGMDPEGFAPWPEEVCGPNLPTALAMCAAIAGVKPEDVE